MRLTGRSGVVTGAASGLGYETAKLLASDGAGVVLADRDDVGGENAAAEIRASGGRAVFVHCDVTVEADVVGAIDAAREEFGHFDYIHNNAGIQFEGPLHETTNEDWDRTQAVNVRGVFWGTKHAVIAMRGSGGGSIVNTGSGLSVHGDPFLPAYTASKHAVLGLTRAVAKSYAVDGIRCNCVCPGDMETPMVVQYWNATGDPEAARRRMADHYPAKRIGKPIEVARAVRFLISDEASYVNGAAMLVEGGVLA